MSCREPATKRLVGAAVRQEPLMGHTIPAGGAEMKRGGSAAARPTPVESPLTLLNRGELAVHFCSDALPTACCYRILDLKRQLHGSLQTEYLGTCSLSPTLIRYVVDF